MKNIFMLFAGILVTACLVTGVHVFQGVILDDWSGVHPYNRVFQLPLVIAVSLVLGVCIFAILKLMRLRVVTRKSDLFKLGLLLGLVGVGSVVNPWVDYQYTEVTIIFLVFVVSLLVAIKFSEK